MIVTAPGRAATLEMSCEEETVCHLEREGSAIRETFERRMVVQRLFCKGEVVVVVEVVDVEEEEEEREMDTGVGAVEGAAEGEGSGAV